MLIYLSVLETNHEKHEFMALYAEYHAVMLRVAKKYFPADQMAREDAVQNAWIKIVKNFQKIMAIECKKRGSYCVIIVKNECISILRKSKAEVSLDELPLAVTDDLHKDGVVGIMTGYEEKFHALGTPIHRCEVVCKPFVLPKEEKAEPQEA